jgi:glycosyltransferase involved in cell wall biosynthesis
MANYSYNLRVALEKNSFIRVKVVSSRCACEYDKLAKTKNKLVDKNSYFVRFPPYLNIRPKGTNMRAKISWVLYDITQMFVHSLRGLAYMAKCKDCDVIHYQQSDFSFGVLPLMPVILVPTANRKVVTAHTVDKTAGLRVLIALYNRADKVIVHSEEMWRTLVSFGVKASKMEIIPHGVKVPALLSGERDEITFFGAPVKDKGAFVILEALKVLKERGDMTQVHFYGVYTSDEQSAVKLRAGELGVSDCVLWGGRLSEEEFDRKMQKSMFTFAVYLAPVSGSSVLTRAMGNATPVIATTLGGLSEYSQNLVLVPPNDVDALADAISKLRRDGALRKRLSYEIRRDAVRISWDEVAGKTIKVYMDVLKRPN